MKMLKIILLSMLAAVFIASSVFAAGMMAGDAEKGKAMFIDPKAFGGSISCGSCHPDGKGLEQSGMKGKTTWKNPAGTYKSLEEAVNVCITAANKGKSIDAKSQEMTDIVAYIKSLGMGMKHEMPMKEKKMGY